MSDAAKKEVEKAAREYVEALDGYRKLVDECVSVSGPGVSRFELKLITIETLEELREAEVKVSKARKKWHKLIRLYRGFSDAKRQSS